jgi:metallophosphoesterase superfamily enzyme
VRTLVISDLHIGAASGRDLLRRAELREPLIEALAGAGRLVVLGDGLELREAAHRDAPELAGPFFAEAGAALGADGELLVLAGNHDHGLVAGWIDARLQSEP